MFNISSTEEERGRREMSERAAIELKHGERGRRHMNDAKMTEGMKRRVEGKAY